MPNDKITPEDMKRFQDGLSASRESDFGLFADASLAGATIAGGAAEIAQEIASRGAERARDVAKRSVADATRRSTDAMRRAKSAAGDIGEQSRITHSAAAQLGQVMRPPGGPRTRANWERADTVWERNALEDAAQLEYETGDTRLHQTVIDYEDRVDQEELRDMLEPDSGRPSGRPRASNAPIEVPGRASAAAMTGDIVGPDTAADYKMSYRLDPNRQHPGNRHGRWPESPRFAQSLVDYRANIPDSRVAFGGMSDESIARDLAEQMSELPGSGSESDWQRFHDDQYRELDKIWPRDYAPDQPMSMDEINLGLPDADKVDKIGKAGIESVQWDLRARELAKDLSVATDKVKHTASKVGSIAQRGLTLGEAGLIGLPVGIVALAAKAYAKSQDPIDQLHFMAQMGDEPGPLTEGKLDANSLRMVQSMGPEERDEAYRRGIITQGFYDDLTVMDTMRAEGGLDPDQERDEMLAAIRDARSGGY